MNLIAQELEAKLTLAQHLHAEAEQYWKMFMELEDAAERLAAEVEQEAALASRAPLVGN